MNLHLSIFLLVIPGFLHGQLKSSRVLRVDHEYLWQEKEFLRQHTWLDALELIPDKIEDRDTAYFQSLVHLRQGHLVTAKRAIQQHAQVANHHYPYETNILLGLVNANIDHKAFGHFVDAIKLNPNRVEGYLEKLKVLSDQKDYIIGIDHTNEAIRLFPEQYELYVFRGNLYVNEGLRKRAFKDFTKVIDAERTLSDFYMAQVHRGLAWSYLKKGDLVQAEIHLLESRVIEPDHPFSQGISAEILFLKGDPRGAIVAFENIAGIETKENFFLMVGLAYEELNQNEKACEFFKICCLREIPLACKKIGELDCED